MQRIDRSKRPHTVSFRVTEAEWKLLEAKVAAQEAKSPHAAAELLVVAALSNGMPSVKSEAPAIDLARQMNRLRRSLRQSFSTLLTNTRKDVSVEEARKVFEQFFREDE